MSFDKLQFPRSDAISHQAIGIKFEGKSAPLRIDHYINCMIIISAVLEYYSQFWIAYFFAWRIHEGKFHSNLNKQRDHIEVYTNVSVVRLSNRTR